MKNNEQRVLEALNNHFPALMIPLASLAKRLVLDKRIGYPVVLSSDVNAVYLTADRRINAEGEPYYIVVFDIAFTVEGGGVRRARHTVELTTKEVETQVVPLMVTSLEQVRGTKIGAEFYVSWLPNHPYWVSTFTYELAENVFAFKYQCEYGIDVR